MSKDKSDGIKPCFGQVSTETNFKVKPNRVVDKSYIRPELRGSYQDLTTGSGEREDYDDQPHY